MKTGIELVIKKSLELCQEKINNNVLLIETNEKLHKHVEFLKAKLPVNKFLNVEKLNSWEILKMPKTPGTYVIEGLETLDDMHSKAVYGWALNGKTNGVRAILVTKQVPNFIHSKIEQIKL